MPKRLSDLEVLEVSFVPKGANRRKFLLFKEVRGMDGLTLEELYSLISQTEVEGEERLEQLFKAGLSQKALAAVKGALRLLNAYKDELPGDILKTLADLAGYGYPEPEQTQKSEPEVEVEGEGQETKAELRKDDGGPNLDALPDEAKPIVEAIWKEHQEAVRKAEELERVLKEERDRQLTKEFIARASELHSLPVSPDELGPALKRIHEATPGDYEVVERVLKAANEALESSRVLEEVGRSDAVSEVAAILDARAKELVQKGEAKTYEQAVDRVLLEQPELYSRYLAEKR